MSIYIKCPTPKTNIFLFLKQYGDNEHSAHHNKIIMIDYLYSTVGIVVAIAYMPQALKLWRSTSTCRDISLSAWLIWNYTAIVSLLYSVYTLDDFKLSAVNAVNVFFITVIICITLYKRRKYKGS